MELKHEPIPKDWRERINNAGQTWMSHLIGHKIHLHSFPGMFTVNKVSKNKLCVTCKKWRGREEWVHNSAFIKIAGGIHSFRDLSYLKKEDPDVEGLPF